MHTSGFRLYGRFLQVTIASRMPTNLDHRAAADQISAIPFGRWDLDALWRGKPLTRPRFGGFLSSIEAFDAAAFGISIPEAELMDPQQRLLLEVMLLCLRPLSECPCACRSECFYLQFISESLQKPSQGMFRMNEKAARRPEKSQSGESKATMHGVHCDSELRATSRAPVTTLPCC